MLLLRPLDMDKYSVTDYEKSEELLHALCPWALLLIGKHNPSAEHDLCQSGASVGHPPVNPVRNSSGALTPAGIILKSNPAAEQRDIISNGVNEIRRSMVDPSTLCENFRKIREASV